MDNNKEVKAPSLSMKNVSFEYCSGCRRTTPHQRQDHAVLTCKVCGMVKGVQRKDPKP